MKEFELKYGCNPNQKPSRIFREDGGDLPIEITARPAPTSQPATASSPTLADSERAQILAALEKCRYNKTRAAEQLGISRRTLHRKLREWNIEQ